LFSGYHADISSVEKSSYQATEADSLENGDSADSLNSLSRDSLDVDHDSLEGTKNEDPICDTSEVEDLYDAREYVNVREVDISAAAPKQFTSEEIAELQEQLEKFAIEIGNDKSVQELNSSETASASSDNAPNMESIFSHNRSLPSPYDLNKQRLSALFVNDCVDLSLRKSYPVDAKLDTVREVTEPSSTDIESCVRLSDDFSDSPRKGSTDNLPNSTQLFEELERQMEEEEALHSNHQTYTVLCASQPDATFTVGTTGSNADREKSPNSSYQDTASLNASGAEGKFNDTLEEIEMLLKYGVDYIYGKHEKPVEEKDERPPSADSCGSHQSGCSTPGAKVAKVPTPARRVPTPAKRAPLTPSKAPIVHRTPSKPPAGGGPSSCASTPARGPPRVATPRSAPAPATRVNEPLSTKNPEKTGPETLKFKVPCSIPVSVGRPSRTATAAASPRPNKVRSKFFFFFLFFPVRFFFF